MKNFLTKVDKRKRQEMVDYLENHFRYSTMNSWNGLHSYAHNVKVHKLDLPGRAQDVAYDAVWSDEDDYFDLWENIRWLMRQFNERNPEYKLGFNGRSGGYIVLYQKNTNGGLDQCEDFEDPDRWPIEQLRDRVSLVQDFDATVQNICRYFCEQCLVIAIARERKAS